MKKSYESVSVVISGNKLKNLKIILDNYRDLLSEPMVREQILEAFKFEKPAAYIKLYEEKTKRRTEFIQELGELIFAGDVYFFPKHQESKLCGMILISRFRNLFDFAIEYAKNCNGHLDTIVSAVLFGTPLEEVAPICSQEEVKSLEKILASYRPDIISGNWVVEEIVGAFTSKKPVTSVDLSKAVKTDRLKKFAEDLKEFFLVDTIPELLGSKFVGNVLISLFKHPLEVVMKYGIEERFADISGFFLLGESPKEVARYCLEDRMKKYKIIK